MESQTQEAMLDAESGRRTRGGRSDTVYETLHREILTLALAPGEPLDETQLSKRFGMSRSPIREALNRLATQGLVVMLTNRSTLVAPLDISRFPKYVEALDLLQRINTRLAAQHRTDEDIQEMRTLADNFDAALVRYDHYELSSTNKAFHLAVAQAGRNPYLIQQYDRLLDEGRRLLHLHFDFLGKSTVDRPLASEHHEMIDAIEARDLDRADQLAHDHTRQFHDRFLEFLRTKYSAGFELDPEKIGRKQRKP